MRFFIRIYEEEYEQEILLEYNLCGIKQVLKGDAYHDKISTLIEGYLKCLDDLGIEYIVNKDIYIGYGDKNSDFFEEYPELILPKYNSNKDFYDSLVFELMGVTLNEYMNKMVEDYLKEE